MFKSSPLEKATIALRKADGEVQSLVVRRNKAEEDLLTLRQRLSNLRDRRTDEVEALVGELVDEAESASMDAVVRLDQDIRNLEARIPILEAVVKSLQKKIEAHYPSLVGLEKEVLKFHKQHWVEVENQALNAALDALSPHLRKAWEASSAWKGAQGASRYGFKEYARRVLVERAEAIFDNHGTPVGNPPALSQHLTGETRESVNMALRREQKERDRIDRQRLEHEERERERLKNDKLARQAVEEDEGIVTRFTRVIGRRSA